VWVGERILTQGAVLRLVLENLFERHVEDISDLEGEFETGRVLGTFNCDDRLTCDSNVLGQSLLCHFVRIET
jgi:hypothetical protein